ncbi:ABC transporter transmembrane domain-containing protein [Asticcacaulis sp. SL142]|uniref:ABC transporter ATP-binding protein n=1 Tax=Asticcacaulis sp. SL142 TaxID=2995155 RepID=UPI00226CEC23|nr:ABC transporter transmembrane domain-containing protein [Asticcacaulis sp. SL142]WAC49752.1 ABC transporter transmembrane domain-containing protein [Asticcacaulis sp. SL142]
MSKPECSRRTKSVTIFKRLYSEALSKYIWSLSVALICMIVIAIMSSSQTYLMGPLIDEVFVARDPAMLPVIAGGVLIIFAFRSLARYLQEVLLVSLGQKIVAYYQGRLFKSVVNQGLGQIQEQSRGRLSAAFIYDANLIRAAVCDVFLTAGKDTLTILTMIGLMFFTDWKMALMCLVLPTAAIIPMKYLGRALRRVSLTTQNEVADMTQTLNEAFKGIRTVQSLGLMSKVKQQAFSKMDSLARLVVKGAWVGGAILPVVDGIGGLAVAVVIIYGGMQVISGALTPGELVVFVGAIVGAYAPIPSLSKTNATLQPGLAAAQRVFEVIDRPSTLLASDAAPDLVRMAGSIRLEDVHFSYSAAGAPALRGVDIVAPAGKVTALVGRSGAGKSTVLSLISRFYDPDQGRVLVNGQDIRSVNPASLRNQIAVVDHQVMLFGDTLAENIRIGRLDARDDEVLDAARATGLDAFIAILPDGMNTRIGEGGLSLSEGQAQRIAIARAFLRDAPILLFDEATNAQDAESERYIRQSMARLMTGRTTLIIAHRLETIKHADVIYVLDEGQVAEHGSHDELIAAGGLYAHLHALQFNDININENTNDPEPTLM